MTLLLLDKQPYFRPPSFICSLSTTYSKKSQNQNAHREVTRNTSFTIFLSPTLPQKPYLPILFPPYYFQQFYFMHGLLEPCDLKQGRVEAPIKLSIKQLSPDKTRTYYLQIEGVISPPSRFPPRSLNQFSMLFPTSYQQILNQCRQKRMSIIYRNTMILKSRKTQKEVHNNTHSGTDA